MKENSKLRKSKIVNCQLSIVNSEQGVVLIASLLLLLVATVVGITALSTSTTNVMISGNQRLSEIAFATADSGVSVSKHVINDTAFFGIVDNKYYSIVPPDRTDFANEIGGSPVMDSDVATANPDLTFSIGGSLSPATAYVDVDYLDVTFAAGGSVEFASGYDGLGASAGAGGTHTYYAIYSVGEGLMGSESSVCAQYRYIPR